ncbi:MAG: hypothetical protein DYG92_07485 [Leptolyngbya sp. PLA1]|nr:hypothetical protein [Leptolyngbya sp. PLA1]
MERHPGLTVFLAACGLLGLGALMGQAAGPAPDPRPAAVTIAGSYSTVTTPRVERITTPERWKEVWKEHIGDRAEKGALGWDRWPLIDFGRYMVVAVFAGTSINIEAWEVESVVELPDVLRVRYDAVSFQTASFGGEDKGSTTTSYGFFVLPRSERELVMEENVQGLIGKPPVWKEKHRFPALQPAK